MSVSTSALHYPNTSHSTPKVLVVVVGPTAVGKTACCIRLSQALNTVIVSADARQCYQGMAIGTAQPTAQEREAAHHHLIDFLPVYADYSAGLFERDAMRLLEQLFHQHDQVIMTGGSGLYLQAVCEGLDAMPPVDLSLRERLNHTLQQEGLPALLKMLAVVDPAYQERIDSSNPRRVIKALEVSIATGVPYHTFRKSAPIERPFDIIKIGLRRERPELYERAEKRVDQMWKQGLLEEVAALQAYKDCNALQTIGYQEVGSYLAGKYDQAEAIRLIKRNTRRYAKRQMTWFGRDTTIRWFHPDAIDAILSYIQERITSLSLSKP